MGVQVVLKVAIKAAMLSFVAVLQSLTAGPAGATDTILATAKPSDSFLSLVRQSLEVSGIKTVVKTFANDDDVLDAILNGSADAGLFGLTALAKRKFDKQPTLFSALTRPFVFHSFHQIYEIEQSPLGAAILVDIARSGIVPLDYSATGLSQILATKPLISPERFRDLTIGSSSVDWLKQDDTKSILLSLGAKPTQTSDAISDFANGKLEAAVWEASPYDGRFPRSNFESLKSEVYATDFEPIVGIVASSRGYWEGLREADKLGWKQALLATKSVIIKRIGESEYVKPPAAISTVALNREQINEIARVISNREHFMSDYQLLDEAGAFLSSTADVKKSATDTRCDRA